MELWARMLSGNFAEMTTSTPFRYLLHAANLRHGTDGFTSSLKEGVLRIFSPGLNPRTWVLKASTLPLDHRSRYNYLNINYNWILYVAVKASPGDGRRDRYM